MRLDQKHTRNPSIKIAKLDQAERSREHYLQVWSELHVQLLQAIHTQTWYVGAENYGKCCGWLGSNGTSLEEFFVCDLKNLGCFLELKVMATLRSSSLKN